MTVIQDAKISNTFEWQSPMVTYNEIHHKTHYDHNNVYLSVGIIFTVIKLAFSFHDKFSTFQFSGIGNKFYNYSFIILQSCFLMRI